MVIIIKNDLSITPLSQGMAWLPGLSIWFSGQGVTGEEER